MMTNGSQKTTSITPTTESGMSTIALPELVPARMLNEYAYCPRLAYLEWVQGEFEDSVDTVEGRSSTAGWTARRENCPSVLPEILPTCRTKTTLPARPSMPVP